MKTPPPPPRGEGISSSLFASPLEKALEEGLSDLLWDLTTHEDKAPPFSEDYFLQRKHDPLWRFGYPHPLKFPQ
jgi:hypothetical protein